MYPSTSQRATLLLAVALGASSCRAATHRTKIEREDTHHTHSTLQRNSQQHQHAQSFDTLTLELTAEVHPLPVLSLLDTLAPASPHKGRGWIAHYHLREIAHRHSTSTDSLHERDTLRAMTHTTSHAITAHRAPTSPLRAFTIGVGLLLLIGGITTLLHRRTIR